MGAERKIHEGKITVSQKGFIFKVGPDGNARREDETVINDVPAWPGHYIGVLTEGRIEGLGGSIVKRRRPLGSDFTQESYLLAVEYDREEMHELLEEKREEFGLPMIPAVSDNTQDIEDVSDNVVFLPKRSRLVLQK